MKDAQRIDRRALFASGAAAALLAATGVSAASLPHRGGRLRMALSGASRDDQFDPLASGLFEGPATSGLFMKVAMFGTLFETLTEVAADGTLRGDLATRWNSTPDAKVWEFDLREQVHFHNGAHFTANDVLGLRRFTSDALPLSGVSRIASDGPHRVRFELVAPDPQFPFLLANPQLIILPSDHTTEAMRLGIGTGPYKVRKFDAGRHLIADRLDAHYKDGRAAWFDTIELVGIASDAVRAEALQSHLVDAADLYHAADIADGRKMTYLPEEGFMTCAVDEGIALPAQIGSRWSLDDLRAPQRWWMA